MGRSGMLVSALGAVVLIGLIGGYLLLQGKDDNRISGVPTGPQAAWHNDDDTYTTTRRKDGPADRAGTAGNPAGNPAGTQGADAAGDNPAGSNPAGTTPGKGADFVLDDADIPQINPDEINEPVPGHLLVRILSREDDRPLPGVTVYFPIRGTTLESDAGDVRVSARLDAMMRRTNRHGVAVWNQKELREMLEAQKEHEGQRTSVLATAIGYADVFEPLNIPNLNQGAQVTFRLFPAVRVTGKVRVHRGAMVGGAEVDILQTNQQGDADAPLNRFRVTADAMGEFSVRLAESYLYVFEVKHPGFANYRSRVFNFREDRREVSILLEPAQGISGVVVNHLGAPIEGAEVWDRDENERVTTNAQGQFAFAQIRDRVFSNSVNLRASAKGHAPRSESVLANDHNIRIRLEPEGTLHGVVVNDRGEVVPGATVRCDYHEGRARYPQAPVTADAEGVFRFVGLGTGRATLTATHGELYSRATNVDVRPNHEAGPVRLTLITGASITGRVTAHGNAIAGVTIALEGQPAGATGSDGVYTLSGIADGKHKLRIVNQFPIEDETLRQLPIFTVDGESWFYLPAEREVEVALGDTATVDFAVEPFEASIDRKVTVRVTTQPNEPATGVEVTINPVFGTPPQGVQPPQRIVASINLPEGRAEMPLSLVNGVRYEVTFVHNQYFTATLTPDALDAVQDGGVVDVTLERAFMIKGYVRDSDGNGLEGVSLSRDRNNQWNAGATTDIYGYFEFGQLQAGEYLVTAWRQSYYREQVEVNITSAEPEPLDVIMVNANEIRIIVNNYGNPQPGAHVHIYRNDAEGDDPDLFMRHFDIGTTDARGEKYVNFHWIRNYQIVAFYENRVAFVNFNNLREEPEREFTIELEQSYPLAGSVLDETTQQPLAGVHIRAHIATTGVDGRDGNYFQVQTNGSGRFEFRVPAGDYHFYVPQTNSHRGHSTENNKVPAGTTGVELLIPLRDDVEGNYAQILNVSVPQTMVAGQQYEVSVTVRNMGSTTWTPGGNRAHRLGSENPRDNNVWGRTRVNLAQGTQVAPQQVYVFTFNVTAPEQPGTYNMQWRMLQERVGRFGTHSPNIQITVVAGE